MTQLMGRPLLEVPSELGGRPLLADLLTGVRTALVGLAVVGVPVLGLWVATPYADSDAAAATRLAGVLWLLGHGAPVVRGSADAPLTVTPLLLGALVVVLLYRAGAAVASRRGLRSRWGGPVALWTGYCGVAVVVALHCAGAGLFRSRVLTDLLVVGLVAGLSTAAGVRSVRPLGLLRSLRPEAVGTGFLVDRLPPGWRPVGGMPAVCRAAAAAGAGLVAAGGLLVAVAAALDAGAGDGRGMALLGRGPAALSGLLMLTVVLLPNAVLWGTAYALGPGFEVGAGTLVSPGGTELGAVPEFPLFALLPQEGGPGGWRLAALLLPLLAGLVPAVLLGRAAAGRRSPAGAGPWAPAATAVAALAAALLLGAGAAALGWLSGGALAAGRMARLGPVPWWTGLAAAGWLAAVAVPGALLVRRRALGPMDAGDADDVEPAQNVERADDTERAADAGFAVGVGGTAGAAPTAAGQGACAGLAVRVRRSALGLRARTHVLVLRLSRQRRPTR
ncbi:DUF6350 family protein [Kitasatospora sp. NPDC101157]|uniref:cell division protein PerM n=1 Tax=Kitasatospora sp. NPDC101157 TaxID=3364098 RepID=UPI0037FEA868